MATQDDAGRAERPAHAFDMKSWLDAEVVPLTQSSPPATIHAFIWNGNPPKEVLVWLLCGPLAGPDSVDPADRDTKPAFDPAAWPTLVHRLLTVDGFRFDYLREQQMVALESGMVPVFGGDGAPLFGPNGMASVRLHRKTDDISLLLQIGCQFPDKPTSQGERSSGEGFAKGSLPEPSGVPSSPGMAAAAAVKALFALFDNEDPLTVCAKYGAVFGQA